MTDTIDHADNLTIERFDDALAHGARDVAVPTRRTPTVKRLFDLAVTVPAAIMSIPVVVGLGALSSLRLRSTPLFGQPRLGHGGTSFQFWKIRTLPRIAPETADKYQLRAVKIPRVFQMLRNRHLDELPQLWHVVAGQMSLVGPRPEMPTLSASFDEAFVAERLSVRPGVTGLWQVSVDSRGLIGEAPEWDLHYVRNHTLRLDLWICYRTVVMMADLREVQSLDEIPRWTGAATR